MTVYDDGIEISGPSLRQLLDEQAQWCSAVVHTDGSANGLASAVAAEQEYISFSRRAVEAKVEAKRGEKERSRTCRAAHEISNETSTCLVLEIIAAFSSLRANLHASRPHRYGRITRRKSE